MATLLKRKPGTAEASPVAQPALAASPVPGVTAETWAALPEAARAALLTAHSENQRLREQVARKAEKKPATVSVKVNRTDRMFPRKQDDGTIRDEPGKGTVSVYGLGRFPVTFYPGGWLSLAIELPAVLTAIVEHADVVAWADATPEAKAETLAIVTAVRDAYRAALEALTA